VLGVAPAGGRVIVAKNPALLAARHPGLGPVTGPYAGRLSNDGDRIELQGRFGEPVQILEYGDDWVDEADGAGYSLVPVYEGAAERALAAASGWRRSAFRGGSPGMLDASTIPDMAPAVVTVAEGTRVRFTGALGRVYSVWVNEDPVVPMGWRKRGSVTAPAAPGPVEFLDTESGNARFYRVTTP
jgi:hypothetical protein